MSTYGRYIPAVLGGGSGSGGVPVYVNFAAFPATAPNGSLAIDGSNGYLYQYFTSTSSWKLIANANTMVGVGTLDSGSPSANGASDTSNLLVLQSASGTYPGLVNTASQSFGGAKTFLSTISASNLSGTNTGDVTLGTPNGLSLSGQVLSLGLSSATATGALSSGDWTTFNNKQPAGNYITSLTGDATAAGPGSAALTLATVNGNVGSFGSASSVATFSVNAKGLTTAAASIAIQIAESQVTNLITDLAGKQPLLGYTPENVANKGVANGYAPLDSSAKIPAAYLPSVVLQYEGAWNPNTNTPTLSDGTGTNGYVYYVTAARTAAVSGLTDPSMVNFQLGDLVIYSSSVGKYQLVTPAAGVSSVNGSQGAVTVNAINQLTGDASAGPASGSQSVALTLATVNSNTGSFGSASNVGTFTVNGKGLITAASSVAIQITESQVTNLVSDLAGKQPTGNYITALTGDATASGPGSAALTLATVNSNVGSFGIATITVNAKGLVTAASAAATTGSGNVVLATSPTLVTPALGTPSALVLTNATGLPLTTGVVGQLPIANGGTGQATSGAAFNALSPLTTKGDLLAYSTTNARLPVGSDTQILVADSTQTLGVRWANNTALTNPMTTLGDTIYGGASGTATRLAGDTSNARKFLNSTASSSTATAPTWSFERVYLAKTGAYTLSIGDDSVIFTVTSGTTAATLPTAVGVANQSYYIRNSFNSTGLLSINTTSSQTIDGRASASIILSANDFIHVISDGANWQILDMFETVALRVSSSNNSAIGTNTSATYIPANILYDDHSMMNSSTGVTTIKVPGKYQINAYMQFTGQSITSANTGLSIALVQNASTIQLGRFILQINTSFNQDIAIVGSTTIRCAVGDTVSILLSNSASGSANTSGACHLSITKIGNY